LIGNPWETLQAACACAGLDASLIREVRMQARRVMDAEGNHRLCGRNEWDVMWLEPENLASYLRRDVDANQIKRLSPSDRDAFLKQAAPAMELLGYPTDANAPDDENAADPCLLPFPAQNHQPRPATLSRAA
jgi:hypothetical protein